jgi:hypothetical protein
MSRRYRLCIVLRLSDEKTDLGCVPLLTLGGLSTLDCVPAERANGYLYRLAGRLREYQYLPGGQDLAGALQQNRDAEL